MVGLVKAQRIAPDDLSDWVLPPPSSDDAKPIRCFDSAEDAIAFIKTHGRLVAA